METTKGSATESARLAEASGLSVEDVEAKLSAGFLFHQEYDWSGEPEGEGEWLDASGTTYVINGLGHGQFGMYWGQGKSLAEAKAGFRQHGGLLSKGYTILTFGPGSAFLGIGAMGYRWLGAPAEQTEVAARGAK